MAKDDKRTLTPRLRFPKFRAEWACQELGQFLTESRVRGSTGDRARKLTVKLWGKGVFAKEEVIQGSENTQYYRRSAGQFIYSKLDFLNQAFGVIPSHLDGFESTVDLPCFDISEALNPIFLLEYVKRDGFYKKLGEVADGGRKAKRIQVESFLSFPIFVPETTREQQQIADCLSSLDELIAAHSRKLDAIKAHKKGLMQQLFPREGETLPRLRFSEFRDDDRSSFKPISEFAKVTTGGKDTQNKVDDGEYPFFVRSQNVERIDSYSHDGEAVLTSGDGVGVGENYHYIKGKFDFHQRVYCIYDFSGDASGQFFFQYFSLHFRKRVKQMSAKNSVDSVRMSMITEMPIWLPQIEEQQRIADCLSALDTQIAAESNKLASLKTHKKGLMQQLFPSPEGE